MESLLSQRPPKRAIARLIDPAGREIAAWAARFVLVALFLLVWQLAADRRMISTFLFSRPVEVFASLRTWLDQGQLWQQLGYTLFEAMVGYLLGIVVATVLAGIFAFLPRVAVVYLPFVTALNSVPRLAFAPLFIAWLGFGSASKIILVLFVILFMNFFNLYAGLRETQNDHVISARLLGGRGIDLWRHVYLPSLVRWIVVSLRVSLGFAWGAAIVGEFVGSERGLGYLISYAQNLFRTADVFAGIFVILVLVGLIDAALRFIERRYLGWSI